MNDCSMTELGVILAIAVTATLALGWVLCTFAPVGGTIPF